MIHFRKITAVLDACVLYPAPVRDLLLHLASFGLYTPKWTSRIHDEWIRNLLRNRPDLNYNQLKRTANEMNNAFPDAVVDKYEALISSFNLPDPADCHVLAAAVRCRAEVIVTSNLKDFPRKYLNELEIEAQHPDAFISSLIDLQSQKSFEAFRQQVAFLKKPPMTEIQVLESLKKSGLRSTYAKLKALFY